MSQWVDAVIAVKSWYERNIHEYRQGGSYDTGSLGIGGVRPDCSGFVSACLRKAGFVSNSFLSNSRALLATGYDADKLKSAGFVPLTYDLSKAQPFDIFVVAGHTEIYAGNRKSYNWGSVHDLNKGGMPSGTSHLSSGYTVMWRHPSVSGSSIPPDTEFADSAGCPSTNDGSSFTSGGMSSTYAPYMPSTRPNAGNTIYMMESTGQKKYTATIDTKRKSEFESLRDKLANDSASTGRDVVKSPEMYNSSILKSAQTAKQERK